MDDTAVTDGPTREAVIDGVREVLVHTLGLEGSGAIDEHTRLLGELPELDSLGIVEVATALEVRFGIAVDDADFVGEHFETVGTLAALVSSRLS